MMIMMIQCDMRCIDRHVSCIAKEESLPTTASPLSPSVSRTYYSYYYMGKIAPTPHRPLLLTNLGHSSSCFRDLPSSG